jgi:hypothetical protein
MHICVFGWLLSGCFSLFVGKGYFDGNLEQVKAFNPSFYFS